jgi:hypothetical protein
MGKYSFHLVFPSILAIEMFEQMAVFAGGCTAILFIFMILAMMFLGALWAKTGFCGN